MANTTVQDGYGFVPDYSSVGSRWGTDPYTPIRYGWEDTSSPYGATKWGQSEASQSKAGISTRPEGPDMSYHASLPNSDEAREFRRQASEMVPRSNRWGEFVDSGEMQKAFTAGGGLAGGMGDLYAGGYKSSWDRYLNPRSESDYTIERPDSWSSTYDPPAMPMDEMKRNTANEGGPPVWDGGQAPPNPQGYYDGGAYQSYLDRKAAYDKELQTWFDANSTPAPAPTAENPNPLPTGPRLSRNVAVNSAFGPDGPSQV